MRYAQQTSVSVESSRAEVERTLVRYGAEAFAYAYDGARAIIRFRANDRFVQFILPLPERCLTEFTTYRRARRSSDVSQRRRRSCGSRRAGSGGGRSRSR